MLAPGKIIGDKYRLQEPIGEGGMATVWRAVHTTLDRPVAVKFLQAVGSQAEHMSARFVQEAKLCAGIRHRNVVDILDFGVLSDQQPYMVMELLDGQSLADRYENGPPLTDWDVLEICSMTLSGLAAVHDAGIVHRDVKPENIFLAEDADGTYPKLIDFGVSKGLAGGQRITRTGAVVGTPEYMSPEQARGVKDIGPASDLWSVGILLFEGFTGQVPFESENPGDVLIRVATEDLPSLQARRPDLPPALFEVVARATHRDPKQRFADARAMRDELLAVLQGSRDLKGRPPSAVVRSSYGSASGSGKLRALSARPGPPEVRAPEVSGETELPIETAKLRPLAAPPRRRAAWVAPLVTVLLFAAAAGAFLALGGPTKLRELGWIPRPAAELDDGAQGAVRPGQDVAALAVPEPPVEPEAPTLEPPPTDGVPAPETETVDVPSPPDPPDLD